MQLVPWHDSGPGDEARQHIVSEPNLNGKPLQGATNFNQTPPRKKAKVQGSGRRLPLGIV
jgi:hypothetical protein